MLLYSFYLKNNVFFCSNLWLVVDNSACLDDLDVLFYIILFSFYLVFGLYGIWNL